MMDENIEHPISNIEQEIDILIEGFAELLLDRFYFGSEHIFSTFSLIDFDPDYSGFDCRRRAFYHGIF